MSILIFGGTGGIGTFVVEGLLAKGHEVTVASRSGLRGALNGGTSQARYVSCDITDDTLVRQLFRQVRPNKVLHLAAALQFACQRDPSLAVRVNANGTANILKASCEAKVERVIFGSSVAIYGANASILREDTPPQDPISIYGAAKWFEEKMGTNYAKIGGFKFIALRYCGVFGPIDPRSSGMAKVRHDIQTTSSGKDVEIIEAGGDERISLTFVRDAAEATVVALEHPQPGFSVYNVAGPKENYLSLRQYHAVIKDLIPAAGDVVFKGRAQDMGMLDIGRLERDLGFRPRYTVSQGLMETLGLTKRR